MQTVIAMASKITTNSNIIINNARSISTNQKISNKKFLFGTITEPALFYNNAKQNNVKVKSRYKYYF